MQMYVVQGSQDEDMPENRKAPNCCNHNWNRIISQIAGDNNYANPLVIVRIGYIYIYIYLISVCV